MQNQRSAINEFSDRLREQQDRLCSHEVYQILSNDKALPLFMEHHIFAVWDFMSLLKGLQRALSCVDVPWKPVPHIPKELTRFINEIVLGEESDVDLQGNTCDHFSLYLRAMSEVGADTSKIEAFLKSGDFNIIPTGTKEFVSFNIQLAESGEVHKIAAAFFYGREKLIPEMFEKILQGLKQRNQECPSLIYYLERHIQLDGDEHSHLAQKCLEILCQDDEQKWQEAYEVGVQSLELRCQLWDHVLKTYQNTLS